MSSRPREVISISASSLEDHLHTRLQLKGLYCFPLRCVTTLTLHSLIPFIHPATMAPPKPLPTIQSAFLSVRPFEPVLVFKSSDEANLFQDKVRQGRILPDQSSKWLFLPLPNGLLRVRTARDGDVAFDFDGSTHAKAFNDSIKSFGRVFSKTKDKPTWDRTVYVGQTHK